MTRVPAAALVWDDRFLSYDLGRWHPFSEGPRKLGADLVAQWAAAGEVPLARPAPLRAATVDELTRFHTPSYVRRVTEAGAAGHGEPLDRGDTPSFPGCDVAAARIVGGTLAAFSTVLGEGPSRAFQPGGGLHHARPDEASGFCIYNDVAVALSSALGAGTVRRAAYVDIDVHHGDGVMYGFYDDGRLLDIDFHQDGQTIFPGTGEPEEIGRGGGAGLKVNVPLPPGAGDADFAAVWDRIVPPLLEEHRPNLIVLQCGVDGHLGDLLGRLRYRAATYERAVRTLMDAADRWASGRLVVTGGGGYEAANVARTLGMVGRRLAGGPAPGHGEVLPDAWRDHFTERTGSVAPTEWEPVELPAGPSRIADGLVGELETALGRKFP